MSNLKDTDIDDLFRRASDKYPLRTDKADWDGMAAALDKEPPPTTDTVDADDKRRKRRFLWLFLLLPLAGAGYFALHHTGNATGPATAAGIASRPATDANGVTQPATSDNTVTQPATAASMTTRPAATSGGTQSGTTQPATTEAGKTLSPDGGNTLANNNTVESRKTHGSSNRNRNSRSGIKNDQTSKPDNTLDLTAAPNGQQLGGVNPIGKPGANAGSNQAESPTANPLANRVQDRLFYDLQRASLPRDYQLAVNVTAPAANKDTSAAKAKQQRTKHFYAGIIGAPDLSSVKMQSVKGVGSTFGIILGYSLNKRWSIETGVYVDRKKYYTNGEYFNTKNVNLNPNIDLLSVNGVCYMWEIPLNIRYNFNPGAKTAWFVTAGFSTYLMSHENYAYGWKWYGSANTWDSSWNIHKPSQYPFSIMNLSAGFEQRLGKIGNLRVEPYVRLPLTGLGTGKLPIMSAGVNIGFTRQLW